MTPLVLTPKRERTSTRFTIILRDSLAGLPGSYSETHNIGTGYTYDYRNASTSCQGCSVNETKSLRLASLRYASDSDLGATVMNPTSPDPTHNDD